MRSDEKKGVFEVEVEDPESERNDGSRCQAERQRSLISC
jgi:hypothetical protein